MTTGSADVVLPILTCGPRGMVGRFYVLNIEAVGSWFQKVIPHYTASLWKLKTLMVWPIYNPGAWLA